MRDALGMRLLTGLDVDEAGNATLEAAQAAGCTEVLVVEPEPGQLVAVKRKDWSRTEAAAYAVGDNQTATLTTWDETGLVGVFRGLEPEDFDLDSIGFTSDEVDQLCERIADGLFGSAAPDPRLQTDRRGAAGKMADRRRPALGDWRTSALMRKLDEPGPCRAREGRRRGGSPGDVPAV